MPFLGSSSIMHKKYQPRRRISSHDPLPFYPFTSHHFPFIYTSPISPHASPFISHVNNRGGTPLQLLLLAHGCPDQPQREKDAPFYYIVVTGRCRCISSLHHTLTRGENTSSSLPSCFYVHLWISNTLDDVWLIPGEVYPMYVFLSSRPVLLLLTESAFLAVL
jgi:hypothetical protein